MCECYKIGGPWITYDPECPAHGIDAQRRQEHEEERISALEARIEELENLLKDGR